MPEHRAKITAGRAGLLLSTLLAGPHCGPQFPPSWLIPAESSDEGGVVDPAGKLRVLAIAAEPPEAAPGAGVTAAALIVHADADLLAAATRVERAVETVLAAGETVPRDLGNAARTSASTAFWLG